MKTAEEICTILNIDPNKQIKRKIRGLPGFNAVELIYALISSDSMREAGELLEYTEGPVKTACKELLNPLFPNRTFQSSNLWRTDLLNLLEKRYCSSCRQIKTKEEFRNHSGKTDGKSYSCSRCMTANNKKYKLNLRVRTPFWADLQAIKLFYANCPIGKEVDHIIPLNGDLVSGLHVINNLQYLSPKDNHVKNNKYTP